MVGHAIACRILALVRILWRAIGCPTLWLVFVLPVAAQSPVGGIRGNVFDKDLAVPLGNVWVTIEELRLRVTTTPEGTFVFSAVPAGTYTLSFSKDGYQRQIVPPVTLQAGSLAEVRCELAFEVNDMEEFVVRPLETNEGTELGLLEVRQEAPAIGDAISADFIKKSGASTAASALKLVVGTSVQDGKYVVIRGLADRYTTTLLNGVRLPSADAEKRAVQLDQFPGAFIESINVSKTFTPDQQGDSTGGSVNIQLKTVPKEFFFNVSGAVEYNTQVTGNSDFLTYRGGGVNTFAMDDGGRALPVKSDRVPNNNGASLNPTPQQNNNGQLLDAMTRSFTPVMGTERSTPGPNYSWNVAGGDRYDLFGDVKLGLLGGYSYRKKYGYYGDGTRQVVNGSAAGQPLGVTQSYDDERGTDEVLWGAVGGLGLEITPEHTIGFTLNYNQAANDEARLLTGTDNPYINTVLRYQERSVSSLQLRGDHKFSGWDDTVLDWTAALNEATQDEPDFRAFREEVDGQTHRISGSEFDYPRRVWRDISEDGSQFMANFMRPFTQWTGSEGKIKAGPFFDSTDRNFTSDTFFYAFDNQIGGGPVASANNQLFTYTGSRSYANIFLKPNRIGLATNGAPAPNQLLWYVTHPEQVDVDYKGAQEIKAGYAMVELPVVPTVKLIGGVRVESTSLTIDVQEDTVTVPRVSENGNTFFEIIPGSEAGTDLDQVDYLPSLGLNWDIVKNLTVRLAWSQTIARPTFRELAPVRSYDFIGGDVFIGNPDLQISHIDNYDVRVEWFRRPGDVLAASVFYKDIQDPIEQITFDVAGGDRYTQRVNYPDGTIYGVEGEARQRLDILHECLGDFTLGANASWIESAVTLPADEQQRLADIGSNTKERPLLGQPTYLLNLNLVYDNPRSGTSGGVFYTKTGEVLVSGESRTSTYVPNLFEMPIDSLDFSIEQKLGKNWRVTFRAKNLTNPLVERVYRASWNTPDIVQSKYRKGIDLSIGAGYSW